MPGYYTEELLDAEWDEREAARGFLDIIHHQLYPLLYQAWLKYRFAHNAIENHAAAYWEIIFSLLGLPEEFRQPGDLSGSFLKYTGILNQRPKTQTGLKTILADYLSPVNVEIEPCVLRKVAILPEQRCKLDWDNHQLGVNSLIGDQVDDRSGKYVVRIGPLTADKFQQILNDSSVVRFIVTVSNLFMVQPLECAIELELEKGTAQPVCLGESEYGILGQSTWLISPNNEDTFSVTLS